MSTPTLDAYRASNPADTRPDSVVIPQLVNQLQAEGTLTQFPDLMDANSKLALANFSASDKGPVGSELMRGASSGFYGAEAKLYSTAAQMGGMTGNQGLKEWGMRGYNDKMQQAAAFAPTVHSMSDVHSVEDAARYGLGFAGQAVPQLAGIAGAGLAGAAIGGPVGAAAGIAGGAGLGATIASGAAMYTQSQNYGELVNQGARDPEAISAGVGVLGAALQAYVPHVVFTKLFGNMAGSEASSAVNSVLTKAETALPGIGSYIMKDMAKQSGTMAAANAATELVTMAGEEYANRDNPNYKPLTTDEVKNRLLEAGAGGAILGAAFGAPEGLKESMTDRNMLRTKLAASAAKDANEATRYAAQTEVGSLTPTPAAVPVPPPETPVETAPIGTPPSAAFTTPEKAEPEMAALPTGETPAPNWVDKQTGGIQDSPVPSSIADNPEGALAAVKQADPDLARRAALGQATPEEVQAAITPPAPPEAPPHQMPAGTPIEAEPPPAPEVPQAPVAPVDYIGEQQIDEKGNTMSLWNFKRDVGPYKAGSTVGDAKLLEMGFRLPDKPDPTPKAPVSTDATPGNAASWLPPASAPIEAPPVKAEAKGAPPPEKTPIFSSKPIADTFPALRMPAEYFQPKPSADDVARVASKNLRETEKTVNTSTKLLAVHDRDTNSVKLLPLFQSTGNKWRTALTLEKPEDVLSQISKEMGKKISWVKGMLETPGDEGDLVRRMYGDESQRTQKDPYVDELLGKTTKDGQQRYTPLATLDTLEPIARRVFEFKDYDEWTRKMAEEQARLIPKSAIGNRAPSDATMEKLKQVSPDHARLAQVLASIIDQDKEKIPSFKESAESDSVRGILKVPYISEISEKLGKARTPEELIRKFGPTKNSPGRWMGLFTDETLPAAIAVVKDPKLLDQFPEVEGKNPREKLAFFLRSMATDAGWKDWPNYLVKASKLGERTKEIKDEEVVEEAREGDEKLRAKEGPKSKSMDLWDEEREGMEKAVSRVRIFDKKQGDAQLGGLSLDELGMLGHYLREGVFDHEGDEVDGLEMVEGNTVLDERDASGKEGPGEDANFEDCKGVLRDFLSHVFDQTRGTDSSMMTDEQLYKTFMALDRIARNTMPAKDDYRETNTQISNRYRATVSSLMGMGVDVNLIETSLDAQSDLLTKEMEQVQFGDARRMLIQSMSDVRNPSMENLRTTLHGVGHILFYNESASVRALLLDAVDRMTNLKLDVFSKTRDSRIGNDTALKGSLLAEEVLAEHLSFFGLKQQIARGLAGRFIGAVKQLYLRAAILWAQVKGYPLDPRIAQEYMESRMQDFVDKTLNSSKDLDVMSGNVVERPDHAINMFRPIGGEWEKSVYDPWTNNTRVMDVVPNGRMETLFNLDNRLQFHDYVIRDTKADKPTIDYFTERYGVSKEPTTLGGILDKVVENHGEEDGLGQLGTRIKQLIPSILKEDTVRFASTDEDFKRLENPHIGTAFDAYGQGETSSPGMYIYGDGVKREILINPLQSSRYDSLGAAKMLVHEIMHAGTSHVIQDYQGFKNVWGSVEAYDRAVKRGELSLKLEPDEHARFSSVERLQDLFYHLKGKGFYPGSYGMSDLHEFVSEGFTNRMFQLKLSKETLPDRLVENKTPGVFRAFVKAVTSLWSSGDEKYTALNALTDSTEKIMRFSDGRRMSPMDDIFDHRAPMTNQASDDLVKKDYEYQYAAHNSFIDLANEKISGLAKSAGLSTADYLQRIFGISDPHDARNALDESLANRPQPLVVNKDLRLSDAKGKSNQLQPGSVRDNIVRSVMAKAMSALVRVDEIHDDLTRRLPGLEDAVKAKQERFSKWDAKLNDLMEIRDEITKSLRKQISTIQKNLQNATFWSTEHHGLAGVAADLFGVRGGGYGMPKDIVRLITESVGEAAHGDKITSLLSFFEQKGMNVMGRTPKDIESDLQAQHVFNKDSRVQPFIDGSPKAKTDLAVAIFAAKTDPENSMLLGIRSEKDANLKRLLVNELKDSVRKATAPALETPDLLKLSDAARQRVLNVRRTANRYRGSLEDSADDLKNARLVTSEAAKAKTALASGIADYQKQSNIQAGSFYPSHGATMLVTPDPRGEPQQGKLSLLPKDTKNLTQQVWDMQKWLDQNQGKGGPLYSAVKSQYNALKPVLGGYFKSDTQKSLYARIFESVGTRLRYTGNPTAKMAADMIDRHVNAERSAEKLTFIGRDVTKSLGEAQRAFGFEKNYDGFIRTMFNPMAHFLEHYDTVDSDEGRANAKEAVRRYFAAKPETAAHMKADPAAFDKMWDFYQTNLKANHGVRDFAASDVNKNPVLVKDPDLPIKDPFTGRVGPSYRGALETGYGTIQRDLQPLFELKRTIDSVKGKAGETVWKGIPQAKDGPITADMEHQMFTPEVIDKFVRPYMDDVSSLHFPTPRMEDGQSYNRADPVGVQDAWSKAGGSLRKFSDALYEREMPLQPSPGGKDEYHQDILRWLEGQYKKMSTLTEDQENFHQRGFGEDFISTNMMDTRKAEDFPPEFTKYRIYDHISLQKMMQNISAHGTMGRDLGLFDGQNDRAHGIMWLLHNAKDELKGDYNSLLSARSTILRSDPRLPSKEVEARLQKQFGKDEYSRLNKLPFAMKEVDDATTNIPAMLTSANGSTREFSAGAGTLQLMVEFMLNNFRSVLNSSNRLIAPYQIYGAGQFGHKQVMRSIAGSGRAAMGSMVQAVLGDARMASSMDKAVHNSSVGLDRANFMTPATIMADTGKNNAYETQRYLGTIRKLRDIVFNTGFRPQNEEERIAPTFRPQAPYSMLSESMDMGVMSGEAQGYNDLFKAALAHYKLNPMDANDPSFKFTKETLNPGMPVPLSDDNVLRFHQQMQTMGTNLELEARDLFNQEQKGSDMGGDVVVPKHLMPLIASGALTDIALSNDINKGPAWMYNTKFGRYGMFLMKWATVQMNQVVGMAKTREGELNWRNSKGMLITMAAGIVPASMLISMMLDEYDEHVLSKKSNMVGFNWDSPSQTAAAFMERTARIGTFGLAGDVANGLRVYGSDGDTRGLSFDQRVVFMNTLMETMSLANTALHQNGHLTYDTFYRPLLNMVGGNSILQYGQIMNNIAVNMAGTPIFQSEWEQTTRINALNYLRGAGRVADVPIRQGESGGYTPTPLHPYMSKMVLSAYANNMSGFEDAYREAVDEARKEGEDNPEEVVKRSFASYHPLKYVFEAEPTPSQISHIMFALSDKGREDVTSAINAYSRFASLLGIKSPSSAGTQISRSKSKPSPKAF